METKYQRRDERNESYIRGIKEEMKEMKVILEVCIEKVL